MKTPVVIHDQKLGRWLTFEEPVRTVVARQTDEVLPALRHLEEAVNRDGLFAAGFLSYEAAPAFDTALHVRPDDSGFPLLWFGLYRAPRESDTLPSSHFPPAVGDQSTGDATASWTASLSRDEYLNTVAQIRRYLFAGDTYQVNYTFRLTRPLHGSARSLFRDLVEAQGPHYSAFVETDSFALCSASPELFFRLDGNRIESRPMKGTTQRGRSAQEDRERAQQLRDSAKNQAENVMIVDMIRNDMGRIAVPGSVLPERLFDLERYPTVWQMVSTVSAQTHASLSEIMTALFPCASITGAPKPRTMDIITREESTPRRIYTGTIGYLAPERRAQFNVAIRTVLVDARHNLAEYGVGGGIVWDSESGDEYEECWLKARVLTQKQPDFQLLETILWTREAGFFLLDRHLERLSQSADYFGYRISRPDIRAALETYVTEQTTHPALRIRLLISHHGKVTLEAVPFDPESAGQPARVRLAASPVDPADRFLYHKTTHRTVYEAAKSDVPDCDDVLLWNAAGELTESTIANVVVEREGKRLTPPVRCGLLPGTFRAECLARGEISEAVIHLEDLSHANKIYLINSVRKWREVVLLSAPVTTSK